MLLMIQFLLMIKKYSYRHNASGNFHWLRQRPLFHTEQFPKMEKIGITLMFLGVNVSGPIFCANIE